MADIEITISTNDQRFFDNLEMPEGFMPVLAKHVEAIGAALIGELQEYPPATEANQPGRFSTRMLRPMGYWERGRGWWYPIMKRKTLQGANVIIRPGEGVKARGTRVMAMKTSGLGGKMLGVAGYRLGRESENLKEDWVSIVEQRPDEVNMITGNTAGYASFVQGIDQPPLMARYGWRTIEVVLQSPFFEEVARAQEIAAINEYFNLGAGI